MDLATFQELLTPRGQAALADAAALSPTETAFLASFERLRKKHDAETAKAALETVLLRVKARAKFADADRMYFTREALEQSTGDAVARYRAKRFAPFGVVADLCCGIGGDALTLAASGLVVHAVESDPLRLAMAKANAAVLGFADRILLHEADSLTLPLPEVRAAFIDPDRRADGRRFLDPEEYTPSLSALRGRFPADFPIGVKIAPGVAWSDIAHLGAEAEFISVERELKECMLWFGALRTAARRATVLPSGMTLYADNPPALPPVVEVQEYLFDPDSAVVRAGLANQLAAELELSTIDYTIALFTGAEPLTSPFATMYRVELAGRFNPSRLREYLHEREIGRVTIVKRGSMIDADDLTRKLKLKGRDHRFVVLTSISSEQTMIVGERLPR